MYSTHQVGLTVLVYNRNPLVGDAVEAALRKAGFAVVGKPTVPDEALEVAARCRPDLLVAGLDTPPGSIDGIELVRRTAAPPLSLRVIVLTKGGEPVGVADVMAAGASAMLVASAVAPRGEVGAPAGAADR